MDSMGFSRALPKEASGNEWAYAMMLGKKSCAYVGFNFPRLEKGIFLQKIQSA